MARTKAKEQPKSGAIVTLKKMAGKNEVSPQAFAILGILKSRSGAVSVDELKKAMEKKVESVQPMSRIWAFYKARLVTKGFIAVSKTKGTK